jgi:putative CocE/NonD family hydrolase
VASLWDQEDIYGAFAVYHAMKVHDTEHRLFLAVGPWYHGQEVGDGSSLGAVRFGSDTGLYFRQNILRPFLAHYLRDAPATPAQVNAFLTGDNRWEAGATWPIGTATALRLLPDENGRLDIGGVAAGAGADTYVSDPTHPVPYRSRPVGSLSGHGWQYWLTSDQREAASRPDVLTYTSAVLTEPLRIGGEPLVHLVASTTGTDSDWVVKLIDVYPDQVAEQPEMGGYQLGISMDIFRGRYRMGFDAAKAITPGAPLAYDFPLPNANHVFEPGHRVMVQIQSSWFPLYDRNPQTFVPNIFFAAPGAYQQATQKIFHGGTNPTYIQLPVVHGGAKQS